MSVALAPHPLAGGHPPAWASEWGEDERGVFVAFSVGEVTQRLRWFRPGRFLMGSPEGEAGRFENEGPRHEVTLSRGFWLGDTPCTQALWEAVAGDNPSRFVASKRPVEQVSWEDCRAWLEALNERVPGLGARLPTEAEWEYACRAGTQTSTYAGELEILGANNAPLLDEVAWYGGNSGVGFELDNGWDSSDWPDKQYAHERAGSHPVGEKEPNDWGLHDMLGNVWEWCEDAWDYGTPYDSADPVRDPVGHKGSGRVVRGGSWDSPARDVRAAARLAYVPGNRYDYLGFRLARGQEG
ncbi:MAG: formylglycine-generating enzyme family protein [bacterium]|nr:formylglycine-generating enzyme family protein [bacterium]